MDLMTLGMLIVGLVFLVVGGELLVRGASALAAFAGVSPLVIGLTVVAFGTSAPELAVSMQAGLTGNPDIAIGNVVGSNIFNVLFVLGACALVAPLIVSLQLVRREVPILIGVSLLLGLMALDGRIGLIDGMILTAGIISYTAWSVISSRRETAAALAEEARVSGETVAVPRKDPRALLLNLGLVVAGLATLIFGSRLLVDGAVTLARFLGVSNIVIGLTIVAIGTSLPEVVTSIVATLRNQRDIAIGNVIGSNIFNILAIAGIASIVTPGGLVVAPSVINVDIPVMIAVALACLPIFVTGMQIVRWEGVLFLGYYVAYTVYLILAATQHSALASFSWAMGMVAVPLTLLVLIIMGVYAFIKQGRGPTQLGTAD